MKKNLNQMTLADWASLTLGEYEAIRQEDAKRILEACKIRKPQAEVGR